MKIIAQFRSFNRPVQLLLLNQLTINLGFYMLIPYLADHLSNELALATWLVGLILGVRNFSQQGMFLLGGALADRFGYKPLIVAGCALRTGGFALLGLVNTVPALIIASAATGFAGALFNPAVRAYVAHDSGERRVEAFALFSVFYQTGILIGPLIGLALTGVSFQLTCLVAAGVFALLTALQLTSLPQQSSDSEGEREPRESVLTQWQGILANRPFLLFALAMTGSYVMSFQVYLALPLEARRIAGEGQTSTIAVAALFAASGLVTIVGQLRITAWCKRRWRPGYSVALGLAVMGVAFLPQAAVARQQIVVGDTSTQVVQLSLLVLSAALLALGTAIAFPFEMDTVVALAGNKLVATHYGFYNTICGIGIMLGNFGTGGALGAGRNMNFPELPWVLLAVVGMLCAIGIRALDSRHLLPGSTDESISSRGRHHLQRSEPQVADPLLRADYGDGRQQDLTELAAEAARAETVVLIWPNTPYTDPIRVSRRIGRFTDRPPSSASRPPTKHGASEAAGHPPSRMNTQARITRRFHGAVAHDDDG